ncbi:MAG TPA: GFA family protein [Lichenihabitans sp.]|jgi:hypothetical protein|nr:GFA family protein [Lichenihabitans sp.]
MTGPTRIGGCFCGKVRYEAQGTPFHETLCHCTDCRRAAGAPAIAWFSVGRAEFRFTAGEPRVFRSSDRAIRRFCPDCGTQLTFEADALPDEVDVTAASLDEPNEVPPRDHSHAGSRVAWDELSPTIRVRS